MIPWIAALLLGLGHWAAAQNETATGGSGRLGDEMDTINRFASRAEYCGKTRQEQCTPDKQGGNHRCGYAVELMIQCMAQPVNMNIDPKDKCSGQCGDGKDFIDCKNGAMKNCHYMKVDPPTSRLCSLPGAFVSYRYGSASPEWHDFGHVEFVCGLTSSGNPQYCSINHEPMDRPFRPIPQGCWVFALDGKLPSLQESPIPMMTPSGTFQGGVMGGYNKDGSSVFDAVIQDAMERSTGKNAPASQPAPIAPANPPPQAAPVASPAPAPTSGQSPPPAQSQPAQNASAATPAPANGAAAGAVSGANAGAPPGQTPAQPLAPVSPTQPSDPGAFGVTPPAPPTPPAFNKTPAGGGPPDSAKKALPPSGAK